MKLLSGECHKIPQRDVNIGSGNGWCHQATSHCLSQCGPRSTPPHSVTRPQWVKHSKVGTKCKLVEMYWIHFLAHWKGWPILFHPDAQMAYSSIPIAILYTSCHILLWHWFFWRKDIIHPCYVQTIWWRYDIETRLVMLSLCLGNRLVTS